MSKVTMNVAAIQARIDEMPARMTAKGIVNPTVEFRLEANVGLSVYAHWYAGAGYTNFKSKTCKGETPFEAVEAFSEWIASLPSIEETRRGEFMAALGKVIDMGRETGIDVDFVNPLVETMQRLSENAITDQRVAA